ncbi:hypothetical protein MUCCIDRAFT_115979 [Mucor lusitanicus CBS 277.49]|uniref:Uncharacterized protein n=1 Tax=Mucor lusitanicus CBS 277.49 TaxID=747725 RepID=A0A168GPH7_MUCCL|nr:hypothetical protein MUCCIDRAFT_115979 [Mucor lusitanicus CBS 277.49]
MNSCHHVLSKVVHYTFKEEALEGRRVIHNTDNKEDNAVKNLKTVSLEEFKKLPIHVQLEYDRFEGNQIQEDLLGGLWRPKASGHSSVEAPTGYEASNYGRYCSALTGDMIWRTAISRDYCSRVKKQHRPTLSQFFSEL